MTMKLRAECQEFSLCTIYQEQVICCYCMVWLVGYIRPIYKMSEQCMFQVFNKVT